MEARAVFGIAPCHYKSRSEGSKQNKKEECPLLLPSKGNRWQQTIVRLAPMSSSATLRKSQVECPKKRRRAKEERRAQLGVVYPEFQVSKCTTHTRDDADKLLTSFLQKIN